MKIIESIFIYLILAIILSSCTSLSDAGKILRNEKSAGTDEFLIKKKNPLTKPPNFETIQKTRSINVETDKEKNNIKKMLGNLESRSKSSKKKTSSTENFILNKIKK